MPRKVREPDADRPLMTTEEFRKLARSYVPEAIKGLRQIAREGKTKSARDSARKVLQARGIKVD